MKSSVLSLIEPYSEPENANHRTRGVRTQWQLHKEHRGNETHEVTYLHCSDFYLDDQRLQVRSGSGGSLKYDTENYETIQVFFDMLRAGWKIPDWLKEEQFKQRLSDTKYTEQSPA